mmetsp:Transcript_41789/g.82203  ORF Transcript_41789/g.82203 Transcript_41789/m.82203 type:complete len:275 (+) Transcript_41789:435-1259(+)
MGGAPVSLDLRAHHSPPVQHHHLRASLGVALGAHVGSEAVLAQKVVLVTGHPQAPRVVFVGVANVAQLALRRHRHFHRTRGRRRSRGRRCCGRGGRGGRRRRRRGRCSPAARSRRCRSVLWEQGLESSAVGGVSPPQRNVGRGLRGVGFVGLQLQVQGRVPRRQIGQHRNVSPVRHLMQHTPLPAGGDGVDHGTQAPGGSRRRRRSGSSSSVEGVELHPLSVPRQAHKFLHVLSGNESPQREEKGCAGPFLGRHRLDRLAVPREQLAVDAGVAR